MADNQRFRRASVPGDHPLPVESLKRSLGPGPFALVVIMATPAADFRSLVGTASVAFPEAEVIACTTAGELTENGYTEGQIVGIALPASNFAVKTLLARDLDRLDPDSLISRIIRTRSELKGMAPQFTHEFAFLMVDGLSMREDQLVSAISPGLGPVPLFGGSAGDGIRFSETLLSAGGGVHRNAAVITFVRTDCPVKVFSLDHLEPTERKMVVTKADPARRIVSMINAEPAAAEYARLVGKDPAQLSPFIFAAHPVVVRLGGRHHVRSIQQVTESGELVFFSAIDEGLVLTVAEARDMTQHLDSALSKLGEPDGIFACDCILRRLEAAERQKTREISSILSRHRVIGFSTYGEQYAGMHVNQTMTGVAIYPPGTELDA